jgi:hypothetical protein
MPYGSYADTVNLVHDRLSRGPYLLGERFKARPVVARVMSKDVELAAQHAAAAGVAA